MIAVIIPAHNEARRLGHCLKAVKAASARAEAAGLAVEVLVVLDRCSDTSALVARRHGVHTLEVDAGNVGVARRAGAAWMIARGAQWLACTDADSRVPAALADIAVAMARGGGVRHGAHRALATLAKHRPAPVVPQPLPGARGTGISMVPTSVCAPRPTNALAGSSHCRPTRMFNWCWPCKPAGRRSSGPPSTSVATSSRRDSRAKQGFGDYLSGLEGQV